MRFDGFPLAVLLKVPCFLLHTEIHTALPCQDMDWTTYPSLLCGTM